MRSLIFAVATMLVLSFASVTDASAATTKRVYKDAHGTIISEASYKRSTARRSSTSEASKKLKRRALRKKNRSLKRKKSRRVAKRGRSKGNRARYAKLIAKHARANGVPIKLAHAVVRVESAYRANARGGVGEIGLMQLRPSTARGMGYRGSKRALYNPSTNLKYGMRYLGKAYRLGKGNTCRTILKYNAGHGAKRMNPISARYCKRVRRIMRRG